MLYIYLILFIFMAIYWVCPIPAQLVLLLLDGFVPDPIPLIDEMLMIAVLLNRLRKVVMVTEFIKKHTYFVYLCTVSYNYMGLIYCLEVIS